MNEQTPGAAAPAPLLAEMQKSDQFHFAAPQTEAKSLQPLLDAQWVEKALAAMEGLLKWDASRDFIVPYKVRDPIIGAINSLPAALGNRTPARQEERTDGSVWKELHAATDAMLAVLGHHGTISARDGRVTRVMDAMHALDAESAAPLPVQAQDTAVLLHGDAFLPDVRQALGEVLTEGLLNMAESPDWNDSDEVDRVIDMVQNVLARQVEKANEGERDIAALRASSAPTTKQGD